MATIKAIEEGALEMDRREDDRSTRESYKDKHKDRAFAMMKNAKSNLQLHHSTQHLFLNSNKLSNLQL